MQGNPENVSSMRVANAQWMRELWAIAHFHSTQPDCICKLPEVEEAFQK